MTRRGLIGWAAGLSSLVALTLIGVVHVVIDSTAPESLAERVEGYTLWTTSIAGVVLVLVATGLAAWASHRALEPVSRMADVAAEWSEHDLGRRFALGPPTDEIRALGQTLDGLLDKVARAIGGEQRLTSELAHELRTPLTAIQATADLMASRPDLDESLREDVADILAACHTMAATMTGLLELARTAGAAGSASVAEVVRLAGGELSAGPTGSSAGGARAPSAMSPKVGSEAGGRLSAGPANLEAGAPSPRFADGLPAGAELRIAMPAELAARALAPVLDNARRLASSVSVTAVGRAGYVDIVVADDGPGVPPEDAEAIFEPGRSDTGGSGLGLALARRIARSAGGDVRLAPSTQGATFVVTLPAS